jgi:anti-sigma factor RsiW
MPADERDRSAGPGEHPAVLPWFVSGRLDPEERDRVRAHLEACGACAAEVRVLAAIRQELAAEAPLPHVPIADLVACSEGAAGLAADRRASIEGHLRDCAACRSDLEAVAEADRRSAGASPPVGLAAPAPRASVSRPVFRTLAAVATVLVLAGVGYLVLRGAMVAPLGRSGLQELRPVTLLPLERDSREAPALEGRGPWPVLVTLPFGAPGGSYRVHIEPVGGRPSPGHRTDASPGPDGNLALLVDDLPGGIECRMVVESVEDPGARYVYDFRTGR